VLDRETKSRSILVAGQDRSGEAPLREHLKARGVPCHPAEGELDSSQEAECSGRKASLGGDGSGVGRIRVGMEHGDEPEAHLPGQLFKDAVCVDRERHVR